MHLATLQWAEWNLITWSHRILCRNLETPYYQSDLDLIERQLNALETQMDTFRTAILTDAQQTKLNMYLRNSRFNTPVVKYE